MPADSQTTDKPGVIRATLQCAAIGLGFIMMSVGTWTTLETVWQMSRSFCK